MTNDTKEAVKHQHPSPAPRRDATSTDQPGSMQPIKGLQALSENLAWLTEGDGGEGERDEGEAD